MAGGQFVPPPILRILANPRFDPDIAYVFWQLSRRPLADWTLSQLALVGQLAPTEVEAGVPIQALQALYQFWGLDPQDIFNPSLSRNWQTQSTAYSREADKYVSISSPECQVDISVMTVGVYERCRGEQ